MHGMDGEDGQADRFAGAGAEAAAHARWQTLRRGPLAWEWASDAHDFRWLGAHALSPAALAEMARVARRPAAVAGVAMLVGFSVNHVSAVRLGSRVVLHNGYHRVCAMRRAGLTHAPCLIESMGSLDEASVAGAHALLDHPGLLFDTPRPPLFKDFFDPELVAELRQPRRRQHVRVDLGLDAPSLPRF